MNHISSYKQSSTFESNLGGGILAYPHTSLTKDDNKLHLVKSYSSFTVKVNIPSSALTVPTAEATLIYSLCLAPKLQNTSTYIILEICSNECGERITNMFSSSDIKQIYINDGTGEVLYYNHGYQISTYESLRTFDEVAIHLPLTADLCDKELTIRYVLKDNAKVSMLTPYTGIILIGGIDYGDDSQYFYEMCSDNYQTEIDVTHLDTSHVKCMYGMFSNASEYNVYDIKFVGLDKLDTSNVLDMRNMFFALRPDGSDRTNKIDVSNFDFSKVQYFDYMFLRTAYYDDDIVVGKEKLWEAAKQLGYYKADVFDVVPT